MTPEHPDTHQAVFVRALTRAWKPLAAAQQRVLHAVINRNTTQLRRQLTDLDHAIGHFEHHARTAAAGFAATTPQFVTAGARTTTTRQSLDLTHPLYQTVSRELAARTLRDLLHRILETIRRARTFHRAARTAARQLRALDTNPTNPATTARQITERLQRLGAGHVRYRDGSHRTVTDWATMATHTRATLARNSGTLARLATEGTTHVTVHDGPTCGWSRHTDPDTANGTTRTLHDAAKALIAHPRCQRTFTPHKTPKK